MTSNPMKIDLTREIHKEQVINYLTKAMNSHRWKVTLPPSGKGHETYFAYDDEHTYFIKLGVEVARYRIMAGLGFAPEVITSGRLANGTSILVQRKITGRMPARKDFREQMPVFAQILSRTHRSEALKAALPQKSSHTFINAGLEVKA